MRIKLKKGKQKELIYRVKQKNNFTWNQFSEFLEVSYSALIEWSKENNLLPLNIYNKLDPHNNYKKYVLEIKSKNWGQIKAGINSTGSLKEIKIPQKSKELAELVGIILGDGNMHFFKHGSKVGSYMVRIAGDKRLDYKYLAVHVSKLFKKLFGLKPKFEQRKSNEMLLIVHSKRLVEFLVSIGLKPGDKIKSQVGIPLWIFNNKSYLKACIRGLIDTDGCIYTLKPKYPKYHQLSFKNYNKRLLKDTRKGFIILGYPISNISCEKQIYLTQQKALRKFYKEIGFANTKHQKRYNLAP